MAIREYSAQCFPEMPKDTPLPSSIPAKELHEVINGAYNAILEHLKRLFADTSQARTLQQSRGRLENAMRELG
jgi:hypothetical protein